MKDCSESDYYSKLVKKCVPKKPKVRTCPVIELKPAEPFAQDIIASPSYHETEKGKSYKIVEMSTKQYMNACARGFKVKFPDLYNIETNPHEDIDLDTVNIYRRAMESGDKFPLPWLEYEVKRDYIYFGQEGRHRALAAETLCDKIPVMLIYPSDKTEFEQIKHLLPKVK